MSDEHFLRVENLTKTYGTTTVVKGVSFDFAKGEFISLLGPSGCGKTTILRMIAGFETPSRGSITVDGENITAIPPNQRRLGMVFQAYALFPNLNVGDNIAFGLKVAGIGRDERRTRVEEMLKLIGLPGYDKRFPYELSGGQQQRVALARAIAPRPRLLLLDEPLSALDAKIRVSLRQEIRAIQRELGITTVFVTHDQEEALSISDRIVVMNAGDIEQLGTPHDIYNRPATRFAATFVGQLNTLPARISDAAAGQANLGGRTITLPGLPSGIVNGAEIGLAIRPEMLSPVPRAESDISLDGTIHDVSFLGSVVRLRVDLQGTMVNVDTFNDQSAVPPSRGDAVAVHMASRDLMILPR
ncbi:ABC transporter ATP-binding protein [Devosia sp. XJ19-1]|uniref:ABC transporter ATP-binding protein n=1 Tax=Devosia ureilytica TaxID=2952754 RepID=A0A9Q4AP94_9HYPH|nr:ABC transporter ATP-binding protein [Devosia ureilytica]MCP8883999.1 ABC transporter ATP-binding protein [Devosia ureilytica]MCP8887607.1 ABC transporter ATP-binding protein [Devosia ureilytica]